MDPRTGKFDASTVRCWSTGFGCASSGAFTTHEPKGFNPSRTFLHTGGRSFKQIDDLCNDASRLVRTISKRPRTAPATSSWRKEKEESAFENSIPGYCGHIPRQRPWRNQPKFGASQTLKSEAQAQFVSSDLAVSGRFPRWTKPKDGLTEYTKACAVNYTTTGGSPFMRDPNAESLKSLTMSVNPAEYFGEVARHYGDRPTRGLRNYH